MIAAITSLHEHVEPVGDDRRRPAGQEGGRAGPAEPSRGSRRRSRPGSKVVTEYLERAGLTEPLDELGFNLVGYGCTTCIGNSGPLPEEISAAVNEGDLAVVSVLSGNRNFEGRINPDVKMNYLASPPLVVAYALAGTMDIDLVNDPLGRTATARTSSCATSGRREHEVAETVEDAVQSDMFRKSYGEVFEGDERWHSLEVPTGDRFAWDDDSTYVRQPPFFDGMAPRAGAARRHRAARACSPCSATASRPTTSRRPARSSSDGPAGRYLQEHGVEPKDFNSYGSRRGNHEVMMRGTFANIRLRNQLAPGTEGGVTRHLPDGEEMSIYDAAMKYADEGVPLVVLGRQGVRLGLVARLGGQGHEPARRPRRDRGDLRAHPPLEPRRHGRAAAAVRRRRDAPSRSASPARRSSRSSASPSR